MTPTRNTTTPAEAASVCVICFGWAILSSVQSMLSNFHSVAFTDSAMLGLIGMEAVLGAIALCFLGLRGYTLSGLYPAPSLKGLAQGVGLYMAALVVSWGLVAPFAAGQPSQPIETMVSSASVSMPSVIAVALVNGTYEEIFLLGFLLRGLRGYGLSIAIGVSLLVRVLYHLYQGPLGALSVLIFGLTLSLYFVKTKALFPVVFAHVLADIIPFVGNR